MTSEELVMLSAACVICNRSVPIYLLEKHHGDHMKNKEQEDKEHAQMLSDMTVIRVIFSHYLEYFHMTGHTLLKYTDEVTEAVHSQLRMFEERHQYRRNNKESTGHAKAQHNCIGL